MSKPQHTGEVKKKKKFHQKLTKYLYERDTLFATLWVFLFIFALGSIPLNLGIMNPIKLGLKDFDFNDLGYSKLGKGETTALDSNIVIINIGHADRELIAIMIDKTASYKPKVMGLDVTFNGPRDPVTDSILQTTINRNKNLVLAVKYQTDSMHKIIATENHFLKSNSLFGYVNFPNVENETIREYFPFKKDDQDDQLILPSFTSTIIKLFDTVAYKKLETKSNKKAIINYSRRTHQYWHLSEEELMTDNFDSARIKGKIALLAYINTDPNSIEDKKFTPMNEKYAGKSTPDMNGIVIHANIISMALENNYAKKVPLWANILIAIIICWLHMSFFIHYYLESHIWFHLAAKIAQVASAIFFVWLGIYLYDRYRLKVDLKWSLIVIIMAVDVIYFYEAWAVWMHKKFNYKTVFKPHHH